MIDFPPLIHMLLGVLSQNGYWEVNLKYEGANALLL